MLPPSKGSSQEEVGKYIDRRIALIGMIIALISLILFVYQIILQVQGERKQDFDNATRNSLSVTLIAVVKQQGELENQATSDDPLVATDTAVTIESLKKTEEVLRDQLTAISREDSSTITVTSPIQITAHPVGSNKPTETPNSLPFPTTTNSVPTALSTPEWPQQQDNIGDDPIVETPSPPTAEQTTPVPPTPVLVTPVVPPP